MAQLKKTPLYLKRTLSLDFLFDIPPHPVDMLLMNTKPIVWVMHKYKQWKGEWNKSLTTIPKKQCSLLINLHTFLTKETFKYKFSVIMSSQILPQKNSVPLNISVFGRIHMILQLYGSCVPSRFLSIRGWVLSSLLGKDNEDIRVGGFLLPQNGRRLCELSFIACRFTGFQIIISRRLPDRSQYCYWWYDTVQSRYLTGIQTKMWIRHSLPLDGQSMGWLL